MSTTDRNIAQEAEAWRARAEDLGSFADQNLVNRRDVFGRYLPLRKRNRGPLIADKRGLTRELLVKHFRGKDPGDLIGLYTTSLDNTCRWGALDIDNKDGDPRRSADNLAAAERILHFASERGLIGTLEDSNGRGGLHLRFLFSEQAASPKVHASLIVLCSAADVDVKTLELFPKQPRLASSSDFGNLLRVDGRHHDGREHWSCYRFQGQWLRGQDAVSHLLSARLNTASVLHDLAREVDVAPPASQEPLNLPPPSRDARLVGPGARHNFLVREARYLWGLGRYGTEIRSLLHALNRSCCVPPGPDSEVEEIVEWLECKQPTDEIEILNERYGVIARGSQTFVLDTRPEDDSPAGYSLLRVQAFHDLKAPLKKKVDRKVVWPSREWMCSKRRREYAAIVFDPTEQADPRHLFNIWQGYSVTPNPNGDWSLFREHVTLNICQGDEKALRWTLGWCAQIVQDPLNKLGTCLVLRGLPGTGKTIFGETVGHLFGRHYLKVSNARHVTGNFNAHLENVLLLQSEEAFFAGDPRERSSIKALITDPTMILERKGVDSIRVPNYTRLLVTSNEDWVVPAGIAERRFTVLDVGEGRQQNTTFFGEMRRQLIERDGYGAFLHYLMHYPYEEELLRRPFETPALREQQDLSMSPELQWLMHVLQDGVLPGDVEGKGVCQFEILFQAYTKFINELGIHRRLSRSKLGTFLNRVIKFEKFETYEDAGGGGPKTRTYWRAFPTLAECRRRFDRFMDRTSDWASGDAATHSGAAVSWFPWVQNSDGPFF